MAPENCVDEVARTEIQWIKAQMVTFVTREVWDRHITLYDRFVASTNKKFAFVCNFATGAIAIISFISFFFKAWPVLSGWLS